jgi:hypothetical protein
MKTSLLEKQAHKEPKPRQSPPFLSYPHGPGTMLSQILESVGIKAAPNCGCKRKALTMNINGNEWCEQNVETIVEWLEEEAKKRSLPFLRTAGRLLVRRAISLSKKSIKNSI